jgi:hypothetical protein
MTHLKITGSQIDTQDPPDRFCKKMREWAALMVNSERISDGSSFARAWQEVELAISKSCLLSRTLYGGENPSKTPCPVHKGKWSGIHIGWPETHWADGSPVKESTVCRQWYDAGCRCFQHGCGCTTGWNVDKACGCVKGKAQQ